MSSDKQITGYDVCYSIHTALRKCCDSTPTSLLWNLIHAFDGRADDAWHFYGELVAHHIADGRSAVDAMKNAAVTLGASARFDVPEGFRDRHAGLRSSTEGACALTAIRLTFELFSEQDWDGAAGYLGD